MRLWTIQGIEIYNKMQKDGFAYCTLPNWRDSAEFMRAYRWMSGQMKRRIGEPPIKEIEYPMKLNTPLWGVKRSGSSWVPGEKSERRLFSRG